MEMELNNNILLLPEEIRDDILSRLPVKSIGRCRCLSKAWRSQLSHPNFIKKHMDSVRKFQGVSLLLAFEFLYSVSFVDVHHLFDEMTLRAKKLNIANFPDYCHQVIASCHGFVLVGESHGKKMIINPVTQHIRELPDPWFALDLFNCYTMSGLGYDSVSDDYKVVTLSYYITDDHESDPEMFVNVYSLKNNTWEEVKSSPYDHAVRRLEEGVFVNGCINWPGFKTTDQSSSVIVGFDLATHLFFELPLPTLIDNDKFVFIHLSILGGNLCMFASSYHNNETYIWVMQEYGVGASWTMLTTDDDYAEFKVVCLLGQQQVVKVGCYLKKGTIKDMFIQESYRCVSFIESLASPHCSNETRMEC